MWVTTMLKLAVQNSQAFIVKMNLSFQQCKLLFSCHIKLTINYLRSVWISGSLLSLHNCSHQFIIIIMNTNVILCDIVKDNYKRYVIKMQLASTVFLVCAVMSL